MYQLLMLATLYGLWSLVLRWSWWRPVVVSITSVHPGKASIALLEILREHLNRWRDEVIISHYRDYTMNVARNPKSKSLTEATVYLRGNVN